MYTQVLDLPPPKWSRKYIIEILMKNMITVKTKQIVWLLNLATECGYGWYYRSAGTKVSPVRRFGL